MIEPGNYKSTGCDVTGCRTVIVTDAHSGRTLCTLDGPTLTARRTAAVTLLGVEALLARTPRRVALIGTGAQARELAAAVQQRWTPEILWAVGLKLSAGLTRPGWSAFTVVTFLVSFALLARALREIPLGTGYAVWTGIGAVGVAILGIVLFGESRDALRLASIALIVLGIVGLKVLSP